MGNIFKKDIEVKRIKIEKIRRNPNQPRKYFDANALQELAQSIKEYGIINPISVRKAESTYEIIAGERRYRAAKMAGLLDIPCIVFSTDDEKSSVIAIIENIQRCNLDFIEEALGYRKLIDDFSLKQEEIARKVGKTQSAIANKLRILKLKPHILSIIVDNNLTERHARAILKVDEHEQEAVLMYVIKNSLNVAKTEEFIEKMLCKKPANNQKFIKIVKDVRLFINTINKSVKIMQEAGVDAKVDKTQNDDFLTYTIVIPVKK